MVTKTLRRLCQSGILHQHAYEVDALGYQRDGYRRERANYASVHKLQIPPRLTDGGGISFVATKFVGECGMSVYRT